MNLPESEFLTIYRKIEEQFQSAGLGPGMVGVSDRVMALSIERFVEMRVGSAVDESTWLNALQVELAKAWL